MADSRIKKVVAKNENLPPINGETESYVVRYRLVSKDRNRYSEWSRLNELSATGISSLLPSGVTSHSIAVSQPNNTVSLSWTPPDTLKTRTFDIFAKWDSGAWEYVGQTTSLNYSILIRVGGVHVTMAVQVPTIQRQRFTNATLFETAQTNV